MSVAGNQNPAEAAGAAAWQELKRAIDERCSFVFEAGAGAGKTYSLIKALKYILQIRSRELQRSCQQVACITYTNVARDMILAQTDGDPAIYCDTTHAFAWKLVSPFQKQLVEIVPTLSGWAEKVQELEEANINAVGYSLGRRTIVGSTANLHHDDIFPIFIELMNSVKFRQMLITQFPVILVDEYQDTNSDLIDCIKANFIGNQLTPQFGFFGDHWQKIYGDGCGSISHEALRRIEKRANFRSSSAIVNSLNRIRPDLTQAVSDPAAPGEISIFLTNEWNGRRETRNHWQGDLPSGIASQAINIVRAELEALGWDFANNTKILMLTHRGLGREMGYSSLFSVFRYAESFTRKTNEVIAYFHEHLEPAVKAYMAGQFGKMFQAIDTERPVMTGPADKRRWSDAMQRLCELRESGTVGDILSHLILTGLPILSEAVIRQESDLAVQLENQMELEGRLDELNKLHTVAYKEIIALCEYLDGHSPFQTKHGVKGDEFENVLVVFGRGWNDYDFNKYFQMVGNEQVIQAHREDYERCRNLFYVAVSRPKRRLALAFTHSLEPRAVAVLSRWYVDAQIRDIGSELPLMN